MVMRRAGVFVAAAVISAASPAIPQPSSAAPSGETMMAERHIERADAALARGDVRTAQDAVRDAYVAAVTSQHWQPLLRVGDAQRRVEQAGGFAMRGRASARANYLRALFRARDRRSLDGMLGAADAFSRLGDIEVVQHALRMAHELAGRDPAGRARVDVAAEALRDRLASTPRRTLDQGTGGLR